MRFFPLATLGLIATLLSLIDSLQAADAMAKPSSSHSEKSFKRTLKSVVSAQYLLDLPADYNRKSPKKWPLILFLHGAGERGTNVQAVGRHGPPKIARQQPDFPFIVVSPQCPAGQWWQADTLNALLDEVCKKYNIDTRRIYLTGLSMGGYGSWSLAVSNPERFAAVAPICGGGETIGVLLAQGKHRTALSKLPIWAFHGGKDEVVKPSESQKMVDSLKAIGNTVKFTVYPDAGHDSWTATYNNPALYDWFLQQKR